MAAAWDFMTLVVSYFDKTVKIWDLRRMNIILTLEFNQQVVNIATTGK